MPNDVEIKVGSQDNTGPDMERLKARLDELKAARAEITIDANDKAAVAKVAKMDAQIASLSQRTARPNVSVVGFARAEAEIAALDFSLHSLSDTNEDVGRGFLRTGADLGKLSNFAMPALIGTLVGLSGQLITVGFGLAGFGAAAVGILAPIEKAAGKAGGLRANLDELEGPSRQAAEAILKLGDNYKKFSNSLAPQVLGGVNQGLRIAAHLMTDLQPVSKATGDALDQLLGRVDAEFQSGTWQDFFKWMEANAGPDLRMIGDLFIQLMDDIPQLTEDLQPLGNAILILATDAAKAIDPISRLVGWTEAWVQKVFASIRADDQLVSNWTSRYIPGARSVNDSISRTQDNLGAQADATHKAAAAVQVITGKTYDLKSAQASSIATMSEYTDKLILAANAGQAMADALKRSGGRIGLHTQAQRDAYQAAQTYIGQLADTAKEAGNDAHKQDEARQAIERAMPKLEAVKGKTQDYKDELKRLKAILDALRAEHNITKSLRLFGHGSWSITARSHALAEAGAGGSPRVSGARGALVPGADSGRDDQLVMARGGELMVPPDMVRAGAVDHLRGKIPGFGAGGIVPSYSDGPGGLGPWARSNYHATDDVLTTKMGNAMERAFMNALRQQQAAMLGFGGGALGGDAAANRALARRMFPWPGWMWPSFDALEMSEAGYDRFATNPGSGAFGIPQALPYSKMPKAAWPLWAGGSASAGAQLGWMYNYIASGGPTGQAFFNPVQAWQFHLRNGWYDKGGWLQPGWTMAYNGTGRPEPVGGGAPATVRLAFPGRARDEFERYILDLIQRMVREGGGGDVQLTFGTDYA